MNVNDKYIKIAKDILNNGYDEESLNEDVRPVWENGENAYTLYLPQQFVRYEKGEVPLTSLRKIAWKSAIKEILWIYQDRSNDVDLLKEKYKVNYWDSWKNEKGNLGKAYGYQINKEFKSPETGKITNQIDRLISELKNNPLNRRLIINLIDVDDMSEMTLIPCAFLTMWTVTGGYLNLTLIQRSGDFLAAAAPGGINAFQYYVLLRMISQVTGYKAGDFVHFIQNYHIYKKHIPSIKKIINIKPDSRNNPKLLINEDIKEFKDFSIDDFKLEDYYPDQTKYDIDIAL
ncbi:thymidylate synthase [Anaerococcus sp. AGMB00486]|uniref:Thymidylate synthase n=2 Tax=Anaerococcus TaxID=165779 RepID=A0ABX2NBE0_9FIRM|nr:MULTISPECIES: thymidylate synthase [Anaerococcus]MSS78236.1 thymidylate synthase [Anaerococcus porci]NVF11994.1 thymidylate synthase [Anaerococcus faecalis]